MAQTETHWFPDGDYPERLNAAYAALKAAEKHRDSGERPPLLNGQDDPVDVLAAEYNALTAEAKADATEKDRLYTLTAINRPGWHLLKGNHPARTEGDADTIKADRIAGLNTDTVEDDLVHASLTAPARISCAGDQRLPNVGCSVENPCAHRAAFIDWLDSLSVGEFSVIRQQSWGLTNIAQFDPKSLPALPTRSNGEN